MYVYEIQIKILIDKILYQLSNLEPTNQLSIHLDCDESWVCLRFTFLDVGPIATM